MKQDLSLEMTALEREMGYHVLRDEEDFFLSEDSFHQILSMERKRASRSRTPSLLMVLDVSCLFDEKGCDIVMDALGPTLLAATRQTDIKGWYADKRTLGVIYTEIGDASIEDAEVSIRRKLNEYLQDVFGEARASHLSARFEPLNGNALSTVREPAARIPAATVIEGTAQTVGTKKSTGFLLQFWRQWWVIAFGDIALITFAHFASTWIRFGKAVNVINLYPGAYVCGILLVLGTLYVFDLYNMQRVFQLNKTPFRVALAILMAALFASALFYVAPEWQYGRGLMAIQVGLSWFLLTGFRAVLTKLFGILDPRLATLVVGAGELGRKACHLLDASYSPFEVLGTLSVGKMGVKLNDSGYNGSGTAETGAKGNGTGSTRGSSKIIGSLDSVSEICSSMGIQSLVVALPSRRSQFVTRKILDARLQGIEVIDMPALFERLTSRIPVQHIEDQWLLHAHGFTILSRDYVQKMKRIVDIVCSGLVLLACLPVTVITAVAIWLDSPGPIFYKQERVGKHGKIFTVWKFRSMRSDAESRGVVWAQRQDPRVTRVGRWIRTFRIDEVPQLWNVFKGDMSLVGPRPERPEFVQELNGQIPYYAVRHTVLPGVTGWAQIKYPYGASKEDALRKLEYDVYYIKNMSILLDMKILLRTVGVVLLGEGAR